MPITPSSIENGQFRIRAFTCSFDSAGPLGLRYAQSADILRSNAVETAAGTARCNVPLVSGMVMSKVRASVLSSGGIKRNALAGLLPPIKTKFQSQRLPGNPEFATDDLHHAFQNLLLNFGYFARLQSALSFASE